MHKQIFEKLSKLAVLARLLTCVIAALVITYFYPHPESSHYNYEQNRPWNYAKLIAPFDIPIHADSTTILAAKDSLEAHFVYKDTDHIIKLSKQLNTVPQELMLILNHIKKEYKKDNH